MSNFSIANYPEQEGKVAVVTGANSGIGFYTAKGLAEKGVHVVMACRNMDKAASAKTQLEQEVKGGTFEIIQLDTSKLESVKAFANEFLRKHTTLHYLINNAGIMAVPEAQTVDGFEMQLGTNYFGHFALTGQLLPALEKAPLARVVSLSSIAHRQGEIHFDNLQLTNTYDPMKAYGQSKLADLIFAYELDRRIKKKGSSVISIGAHPGVSNTNLGNSLPWPMKLMMPLFSILGHAPRKAAYPSLMAALDPSLLGGEYIGPTGFYEFRGDPGKVKSTKASRNEADAKKLWSVSEELTGIHFLS